MLTKYYEVTMKNYVQCVQNENANVTPQETIYAIKKAGFKSVFVQWYDKDWEFSQQEQVDLCKKLGLEIAFAHLGYKGINNIWLEGKEGDLLVENYFKNLEDCKANGINLVVMHFSSGLDAAEPNEIGLNRYKKIVEYAEKLNIKVAFENTKKPGYLEYVLGHLKNANAGVCLDSGHLHCHFKGKFSWEMFKDRIFALHLHDNMGEEDEHLLPFDGTLDWKDLTEKLKSANYSGPISLESCYRNAYLKMDIKKFYKLSLKKAKKIKI